MSRRQLRIRDLDISPWMLRLIGDDIADALHSAKHKGLVCKNRDVLLGIEYAAEAIANTLGLEGDNRQAFNWIVSGAKLEKNNPFRDEADKLFRDAQDKRSEYIREGNRLPSDLTAAQERELRNRTR